MRLPPTVPVGRRPLTKWELFRKWGYYPEPHQMVWHSWGLYSHDEAWEFWRRAEWAKKRGKEPPYPDERDWYKRLMFYWARRYARSETDYDPEYVRWVDDGAGGRIAKLIKQARVPRFMCMAGGERGGKSYSAAMEAMQGIASIRNGRTWLVAPTYSLGEKEFRYILEAYRRQAKHCPAFRCVKLHNDVRSGALDFTTPWGHVVEVKSADNKTSLLGDQFEQLILCEASMLPPDVWVKYLRTRAGVLRAKVMGNTTFAGRNWYHQELFLPGMDPREPDYFSIQVSLEDVPHYPKEQIEENRRWMPPDVFRERVLGEAVNYSGLVYPEFREVPLEQGGHIGSWAALERASGGKWREWVCYEGVDPGIGAPTGCLWALVEPRPEPAGSRLWIIGEMYERNMIAQWVAEQAKRRRDAFKLKYPVEAGCADPSASRRDPTSGKSVLDCYGEAGWWLVQADNTIETGVLAIKSLLHQGRIVILEDLYELRREMGTYEFPKWDSQNWTQQLKPAQGKFHLADCLRYIVNTFPVAMPGAGHRRGRDEDEGRRYDAVPEYRGGLRYGYI